VLCSCHEQELGKDPGVGLRLDIVLVRLIFVVPVILVIRQVGLVIVASTVIFIVVTFRHLMSAGASAGP
jgi:hypothetical protein